jgi:Tol biopolymer transport system component
MNTEEKIEQCLRAAPKPPAPDSLVNKLRKDIILREVETRQSALRRLFAPSGEGISRWRVAAAAVISMAVLLPLCYGATRLMKRFIAISQLPAVKQDFPYSSAALSPDSKHFAGITWRSQLVVIDTSTGEQQNLAEGCYGSVVWSADGSEIAVTRYGKEKETLVAVSLKTGKTRTLMESPPYLQDWAPDGKSILAVGTVKAAVRSVVMVDLENNKETVLAKETENWPSPRFSPKGDQVSFVTAQAGKSILHLRKIDGTSHVEYSDFPGEISLPLWSPDATHIVFTGTQRGIGRRYKDLWALRIDGDQFIGAPFPVVPDVEQMEFYNWSQNGQLVYRTSFELGGMFTVPVDSRTGKATGSPRQLVRRGAGASHCWSPDGKQIAFREGGELIFISADSGEKIRNLPLPDTGGDLGYYGRGISWSPNSRWIAFSGFDKERRAGIFLAMVETGDVRRLVSLDERLPNFDPTWAPDSKTIAYGYKGDVYVVEIEDGKPRKITPSKEEWGIKGGFGRPVFAPDGGSVAYIAGQRVLATTIDGQKTRQVFQLKNKDEKSTVNIFDWSPDGRHIVFTPGNKEIWCAPTDDGEPFQIAELPDPADEPYAWMPKWSPTGDSIAFFVSHEKYRYWVMTDFLPLAKIGRQ